MQFKKIFLIYDVSNKSDGAENNCELKEESEILIDFGKVVSEGLLK
ncbi:MAG: hypothetical protein PHN31_00040 [Candidatus Gracilibacteria bacterium]|nr:hypothetical protein [Candidatus Gracilibacteria bacterium]